MTMSSIRFDDAAYSGDCSAAMHVPTTSPMAWDWSTSLRTSPASCARSSSRCHAGLQPLVELGALGLDVDAGGGQGGEQVPLHRGSPGEEPQEPEEGLARVAVVGQLVGGIGQLGEAHDDDGLEERFFGREVPVERPDPEAGTLGHGVHGGRDPLGGEDLLGRLEDPAAVLQGVGPHRAGAGSGALAGRLRARLEGRRRPRLVHGRRFLPRPLDKRNARSVF